MDYLAEPWGLPSGQSVEEIKNRERCRPLAKRLRTEPLRGFSNTPICFGTPLSRKVLMCEQDKSALAADYVLRQFGHSSAARPFVSPPPIIPRAATSSDQSKRHGAQEGSMR
jgi:hypothetical protein